MSHHFQTARDISYAFSARTRSGRTVIRTMENLSGRMHLIGRAQGYEAEIALGECFWSVMIKRYGLSLDILGGSLDNIPPDGPLILVANHPFGILDGLMMGHILSQTRRDFRILAHKVFHKARELNDIILPISFDETKAAVQQNLQTRKEALQYLGQGGAIGIFPGGTVSTSAKLFSRPLDPDWRSFTARMVARSGATVVPVFFDGECSRLFQLASHLHQTLRMGLLIREFRNLVDRPVRVVIGAPIEGPELRARAKAPNSLMEFLRCKTYELSPEPLDPRARGFEFG